MNEYYWSTIVEIQEDGKWVLFSQQSTPKGQDRMSDEEYLEACRSIDPQARLRIRKAA